MSLYEFNIDRTDPLGNRKTVEFRRANKVDLSEAHSFALFMSDTFDRLFSWEEAGTKIQNAYSHVFGIDARTFIQSQASLVKSIGPSVLLRGDGPLHEVSLVVEEFPDVDPIVLYTHYFVEGIRPRLARQLWIVAQGLSTHFDAEYQLPGQDTDYREVSVNEVLSGKYTPEDPEEFTTQMSVTFGTTNYDGKSDISGVYYRDRYPDGKSILTLDGDILSEGNHIGSLYTSKEVA